MSKVKEWRALDHCDDKRNRSQAIVEQDANQKNITKQQSEEWIIIKDSEYVGRDNGHTSLYLYKLGLGGTCGYTPFSHCGWWQSGRYFARL
uniref:spore coat protein n=1 Tax=Flavobacterium myungsuense TaxID=651823 RepID=UPI0036D391E0